MNAERIVGCKPLIFDNLVASMRPHSDECGKAAVVCEVGFGDTRASMRPHSDECGKVSRIGNRKRSIFASMRPHSDECGKVKLLWL